MPRVDQTFWFEIIWNCVIIIVTWHTLIAESTTVQFSTPWGVKAILKLKRNNTARKPEKKFSGTNRQNGSLYSNPFSLVPRWRHNMKDFRIIGLLWGNSPMTGGFTGPVMLSFDDSLS